MARRGLLAEIHHQVRMAEREAQRRERAAAREYAAALRHAEQARKADQRARAAAARAAAADRKRLEKEMRAAHIAAMQAEASEQNARLAEINEDLDGLLAATLGVDDYVELETLRRTAQHPPFDRSDLEVQVAPPAAIPDPPEPKLAHPPPPRGIFAKLFGKKKRARAIAAAEAAHAKAHATWLAEVNALPKLRQDAAHRHADKEASRLAALQKERQRYDAECLARETAASEHNERIDTLITNLAYGTVDAVHEYISIVLSNSVYPDHFPVDHDFQFDPTTAELNLRALIPPPTALPEVKEYKYTKSSDSITAVDLPSKGRKERYASAIAQVALRSLHEVFEADRRGVVKSIALEVGTETKDPATGTLAFLPLAAVTAAREAFMNFDLSAVVPARTLEHLGAVVSRNPYELVAIDPRGVRRS